MGSIFKPLIPTLPKMTEHLREKTMLFSSLKPQSSSNNTKKELHFLVRQFAFLFYFLSFYNRGFAQTIIKRFYIVSKKHCKILDLAERKTEDLPVLAFFSSHQMKLSTQTKVLDSVSQQRSPSSSFFILFQQMFLPFYPFYVQFFLSVKHTFMRHFKCVGD